MTSMGALFREMQKILVWCPSCHEFHRIPELKVVGGVRNSVLLCPKQATALLIIEEEAAP